MKANTTVDCTCHDALVSCACHDQVVKLPWWERLRLLAYLLFLVIPRAAINVTRASMIALCRGLPLGNYITSAVIGTTLFGLAPSHIQYISETSQHTYKSWMRATRSKAASCGEEDCLPSLQTEIQSLPDGRASLFWLGNRKSASKYVLFFHGGGYIAPLLPGHLEWCWRVFVSPHVNTQHAVAVAILDYTLCPTAQFPIQLYQAIAALKSLLSSGIRPDQIMVGGDSAGGNLTAHLLSHIACPESHAPLLKISQPLLGAFLVSPWLSRDTSQRSMAENSGIDMLTAQHIVDSSRNFYGTGATGDREQWSKDDILAGKEATFEGMTSIVSHVYVTAGKHEVLRDQAVQLVDMLRHRNNSLDIRLEIAKEEAHDFILLEGQQQQTGPAMERMVAWLSDLIP